jgi:perosamine synthetase
MEEKSRDLKNNPFLETLQVPLARPAFDAEEVEAAMAVVKSGYLCQGPKVAEFEAAFAEKIQIKNAVAVSSGSTALLVALQALGIGSEDEVIVPDMTFVSTATAAMYLGAKPVLCDITLTDYNIDPDAVDQLVSERTKGLIPVHYAGHSADMAPLLEIAQRHDLFILEDAAEAHLARYQGGSYCGTIGDIGIFSFTPTKPMTTGEGGMIVTDNEDLAEQCRLIRNFGDHGKFAWHSLGFNFRMNEVAAAIGLCQLRKLDGFIDLRREKAKYYDEALDGEKLIVTPTMRTPQDGNYQLYTIRIHIDQIDVDRNAIQEELTNRGVSTRLYYPALHKKGVFRHLGPFNDAQFVGALKFEETALSLPIFSDQTREEQDMVIGSLLAILHSHRK